MTQIKGSKCYEIFIVNLSTHIDEPMLFKAFQHFGWIAKIKIQRDLITKESRGIGFIEYCDPKAGFKAINMMSNKKLYGQTIQVYNKSWYKENISDNACVVIQNLSPLVTEMQLKQLFRPFGFIFSVKITKGVYDQLSSATVQYLKDTMALEAIAKMNGQEIQGEKVQLRLGCKECQVFLKVKADSLEISNLLKKILGEFFDTCYISQMIQNRNRDKVLVHVHFQTIKEAEEFKREFEGFSKIKESQKQVGNVEEKFLALEDVKSYDERIQISKEFQAQQRIFSCYIWPIEENYQLEKIQSVVEGFVQSPQFAQVKKENQLKYKYLEKLEQKEQIVEAVQENQQEENKEAKETKEQAQVSESVQVKTQQNIDFMDVLCEVKQTRLNRNYLMVKFRNSEIFQEFVRSVYFKHSEIYQQLKEFECANEQFQVTYDYNTIYNMKNEIHNKLKQKKKPIEVESQFSQFNFNAEKVQDVFQGEQVLADQRIDFNAKEELSEDQMAKEQEKIRESYKKDFQSYSDVQYLEGELETFNFLPKNVRILILYDILIKKIKEYGLMMDGMNLGELSFKIYEVMKENVLLEEEMISMIKREEHIRSFLQAILEGI